MSRHAQEDELLNWYFNQAKPFLEKYSGERIAGLDNEVERLRKLLDVPESITVCFLGNSGIGKSTLLNALAAGAEQVLPAGGIGPLTAQATEVFYSEVKTFRVRYQPKGHLWRVGFALEGRLTHQDKGKPKDTGASAGKDSDFAKELDEATQQELLEQAEHDSGTGEGALPHDPIDGFITQARQIVTGNQFSDKPLPYLVDALRAACGYKPRWHSSLDAEDQSRIDRVREVIADSGSNRTHERSEADDRQGFMADLKAHAAGFLSPLIEKIQVGWPSDTLKAGVVLVDLPGVGIAKDAYRQVTHQYVQEKARAVIVVVDRAGPTESTVELLRTSGYWDRLVGATDDPDSDPCAMLMTVTKVDDVAAEEWRNLAEGADGKKPKKREVFARLVEEFRPRMQSQITQQLGSIGGSDNETVSRARALARQTILDSLEIHPVSAPEYRKILMDDEEDRAFLTEIDQTGIPQLQASLVKLSARERETRQRRINEVREGLSQNLHNELAIIRAQWRERTRAAEEADKLADALEIFMAPKRKEYDLRVGGFRGYLGETVEMMIQMLVLEARAVAEAEVNQYLRALQSAHWATLRATVRRGGSFYGSRHICLPDDIAGYFQEPMAAVWGQTLLSGIRERTAELSADITVMVEEICAWAAEHGGTQVSQTLLDNQQARIAHQAAQMNQVGKEAVDELRALVRQRLKESIRQPIEVACQQFVDEGNDLGPGVKGRILSLFNRLAKQATEAAREPAIAILQTNYSAVRDEIQRTFEQLGDPLQGTADLVVERHEERVKRSDAQRRNRVLTELDAVYAGCPDSALPVTETTQG